MQYQKKLTRKNAALVTLSLLMCALAPSKALADEVWSTEQSDVIYQEDRGSTAIWSYENNGESGSIFIDGLAGVFTDRGSYTGYWAQAMSSLRCDTYREGIDGEATYYWGRFEISFIDPDFPSRWHAHYGLCDRPPTFPLNGTPLTP
ncbi:MAG: hypothetical protein HC800_09940 [Phormidesmis sp. RL_2_1]|nr:hypothetical protein [Phormidesmis sp. RL_2_1]